MSADMKDRMKNENNLTTCCAVIQRAFVSSLAEASL